MINKFRCFCRFVRRGFSECSIEGIPEARRKRINLSRKSKYYMKKLQPDTSGITVDRVFTWGTTVQGFTFLLKVNEDGWLNQFQIRELIIGSSICQLRGKFYSWISITMQFCLFKGMRSSSNGQLVCLLLILLTLESRQKNFTRKVN